MTKLTTPYKRIGDIRAEVQDINFLSLFGCSSGLKIIYRAMNQKSQLFVRLLYFCSGSKIIECPASANAWPLYATFMRLQILIYLLFTLSACGQTEKNSQQTSTISQIDTLQKHTENMSDYSPTFDKAHPNAKRLMNEAFYFNPIDEYGPFGNDDGADTYAGFQEWRRTNKTKNPKEFLVEEISRWGYPTFDYYETNFEKLKPYLKQSEIGSRLLTGTDASIIAIAFGQLYLKGTIDKNFKELAKAAIKRELIPEMLLLWGTPYGIEQLKPKPDDPTIVERSEKLKKMQAVLDQVD